MLHDNLPAEYNRNIKLTNTMNYCDLECRRRTWGPEGHLPKGGQQRKKAVAHGEEAKATEGTQ